ncbi:lytic transglycosylase domain-containing protein [Gallaecimonas sp. GXIMD1310]|uniref:lytic transglycosylase domain-containing protein n=1 Tax=Gallaecimonas sp. GXIMD1310 TaxID=3131926 RepID=UPI00324EB746
MDLPPPQQQLKICVAKAALDFKLASSLLWAIIRAEGGKKGSINKNSNGTVDLGVAQINSVHIKPLQRFYPGLTRQKLANDTCLNVHVAARLLHQQLVATQGDIWEAVGRYHSRTDQYKSRYQQRVVRYWLEASKKSP